jgi:hypothetical protein
VTTSGNYGFTVNRDQILRMAALNLGRLEENETLSPQETIDMSVWLNMLVKQWMGKADFAPGLKAFTRKRGHLLLSGATGIYAVGPTAQGWTNNMVSTASTAAVSGGTAIPAASIVGMTIGDNIALELDANIFYYTTISSFTSNTINTVGTIPSNSSNGSSIYTYTTGAQQPQAISAAVLRDSTGNDTPMDLLTSNQYDLLSTKAAPANISDPISVYWNNQLGTGYIQTDVYAAADLSKHIVLTYLEPTQDFSNPNDTPEYPQEWYLPLALWTSKLCAPMFQVPWTQDLNDSAKTALSIAQNKDTERETIYFQPGAD